MNKWPVTCGVSGFDLSLQLQRDARHLLVGGVASASPLGLLGGVAFEVDKGHQAVAAGLSAACGGHRTRLLVKGSRASFLSSGITLLLFSHQFNLHQTHLDRASVLCLLSSRSTWGAGDIWRF